MTFWHHADADHLEAGVHALLAPYRINPRREFFQVSFPTIKEAVEREIARMNRL